MKAPAGTHTGAPEASAGTMKNTLVDLLRTESLDRVKSALRVARGLFFAGGRYECPCCGWRLRGFVDRLDLVATNSDGYCPRCNAKARHRRVWLYLRDHTNVMNAQLRLLDIAPWRALSECYQYRTNIEYAGLDLHAHGPHVTQIGDITAMPYEAAEFDAVVCIHVLEHIEADRLAISEIYRVLKPGGWAVIAVPIRMDQPTYEDPSITDPAERKIAFGERNHVRYYGADFADRLAAAGFRVKIDLGSDLPDETCRRHGLRKSETIFHCIKPA